MMSTRGIATEMTRTLMDTQLVSSPQQCSQAHSTILQEVSPRKQNFSDFSHPRALISLANYAIPRTESLFKRALT